MVGWRMCKYLQNFDGQEKAWFAILKCIRNQETFLNTHFFGQINALLPSSPDTGQTTTPDYLFFSFLPEFCKSCCNFFGSHRKSKIFNTHTHTHTGSPNPFFFDFHFQDYNLGLQLHSLLHILSNIVKGKNTCFLPLHLIYQCWKKTFVRTIQAKLIGNCYFDISSFTSIEKGKVSTMNNPFNRFENLSIARVQQFWTQY